MLILTSTEDTLPCSALELVRPTASLPQSLPQRTGVTARDVTQLVLPTSSEAPGDTLRVRVTALGVVMLSAKSVQGSHSLKSD